MTEEKLVIQVAAGEGRARLDRFLAARIPDRSRSYLQKLISEGHVHIIRASDTGPAPPERAGTIVNEGDCVTVFFPPLETLELSPEDIPLSILHEDDQIVVLDKPAGLVVHPGAGARSGTLVHALLHHCRDLSGIGGVERPGIVHRLDKDTSGVLIVAKSDAAHRSLSSQFQARSILKVYLAVVWGEVSPAEGSIDVPIGRDTVSRVRVSTRSARPREAFTRYRVLERPGGFSFVEISPRTGRTHQIRVHLKHLGHPIVGDVLYGGARYAEMKDPDRRRSLETFGRLALHARELTFTHPATGARMTLAAPVPSAFETLMNELRG